MPENSGSQYKSPILDLKGGLWVFKKSQKILTASDQYFLSYVKKTTGEGGQIDLPPSQQEFHKALQFSEETDYSPKHKPLLPDGVQISRRIQSLKYQMLNHQVAKIMEFKKTEFKSSYQFFYEIHCKIIQNFERKRGYYIYFRE